MHRGFDPGLFDQGFSTPPDLNASRQAWRSHKDDQGITAELAFWKLPTSLLPQLAQGLPPGCSQDSPLEQATMRCVDNLLRHTPILEQPDLDIAAAEMEDTSSLSVVKWPTIN